MQNLNGSQRAMSQQMSAVMTIISSCPELNKTAGPFIDLRLEQIDWNGFFKKSRCLSQKAALYWVCAFWRDEVRPRFNLFENSALMDEQTRIAVLYAAMIRWGLDRKSSVQFEQTAIVAGGAA